MEHLNIILPVVSAVLAGALWSTVGIWSKWRSGKTVDIDTGKLKKNLIIGVVVGAVAYAYGTVQGDPTPIINSAAAFFAAVAAYFPIIIIVDKLLVKKGDEEEEFVD